MRPAVFMSPLAVSVPQLLTMEPIVWSGGGGVKCGHFVSIISPSLMFDVVGDRHFLSSEAGLLSVPSARPLCWHRSSVHHCVLTPAGFFCVRPASSCLSLTCGDGPAFVDPHQAPPLHTNLPFLPLCCDDISPLSYAHALI